MKASMAANKVEACRIQDESIKNTRPSSKDTSGSLNLYESKKLKLNKRRKSK